LPPDGQRESQSVRKKKGQDQDVNESPDIGRVEDRSIDESVKENAKRKHRQHRNGKRIELAASSIDPC
jgi:hypothetical protein